MARLEERGVIRVQFSTKYTVVIAQLDSAMSRLQEGAESALRGVFCVVCSAWGVVRAINKLKPDACPREWIKGRAVSSRETWWVKKTRLLSEAP